MVSLASVGYPLTENFPERPAEILDWTCLKNLDHRVYNEKNIASLQHLLEVSPCAFPLTDEEEKVLRMAQRTDYLVMWEYGMNYTRFFVGAACGIVAICLLVMKKSEISPWVNSSGAAFSGSLGLAVTLVRGVNLQVATQNRPSVVTALSERHKKVAHIFLKIHLNNRELGKKIGTELEKRIARVLENKVFFGLKSMDVVKTLSPLQEVLQYIVKDEAPESPDLDMLILLQDRVSPV